MISLFNGNVPKLRQSATSLLPRCGLCRLKYGCKSPLMPVDGEGRRRILVVGEAPGEREDEQGRPFVGKAGNKLSEVMGEHGVDLRRDCWLYNALICHPPNNEIKKEEMIDYCRPNVIKTINDLQPETIIVLGGRAVRSVVGWLWRGATEETAAKASKKGKKADGAGRWAGYRIPNQKLNAWICPTWHPSYVLREDNPVLGNLFSRHLGAATALQGRPWASGPPDYRRRVEQVLDPATAAGIVREMTSRGGCVAWDLETDRLKPYCPEARIVCCSVCWEGRRTVAFPWVGDVVNAVLEMLVAPNVFKIGANLKFEHTWILALYGVEVVNWVWDVVTAAHTIDNRLGTAGVKFQAFVKVGQEDYDSDVKPLLYADGAYTQNRIKEIPLNKLLLYNGLDSLLEFEIARIQSRETGVPIWTNAVAS